MEKTVEHKWSDADVRMLIKLRGVDYKRHFKGKSSKNQVVWELIQKELENHYDIKVISKKWSNLVQKYKTVKYTPSGQPAEDGSNTTATWPYFGSMDEVFQSFNIKRSPTASSLSPPASPSSVSPPASPAISAEPQSSQLPACGCGRSRTKNKRRKKQEQYMKALLKQNNKMIKVLNEILVVMGGKGLTGKVTVSLGHLSSGRIV